MKRVLMRLWAAFWFSVLAVSASAQQPTTSNAPFAPTETGARIVYRNASLIDGSGGPMRPDMVVVTNGQRIEAVLPNAELSPEMMAGAEVVDLGGQYLLPGLIDSNQPLATPPDRRRAEEIGLVSCRDRVCQYDWVWVVAVPLTKTKRK